MKNWISLLLIVFVLVSGCRKSNKTAPVQKERVLDPTIAVKTFIKLDNPAVVFAKMCTEDPSYKYMYYLSSNLWVASNNLYCVGDTLTLQKLN